MKEHNGTIEAANAPGGGAVFTVTLQAAGCFSLLQASGC